MTSEHITPETPGARPESQTLTLSHSQVETYVGCRRRWYLQKVARLPQAPSGALLLGDGVHVSVEADGRRRSESGGGDLLELPALIATFERALGERLAKDDPWNLLRDEVATLRARGRAMLTAYSRQFAPGYCPSEVEAPFPDVTLPPLESDQPDMPTIRFTGRIDARGVAGHGFPASRDTPYEPAILDFKSSSKVWPVGAEHAKPQGSAYLMADARSGREEPAQRVVFVVMSTRQTGPDGWVAGVEQRETTRTPAQLTEYERQVRSVGADITQRKALAARAGSVEEAQSAFPANTGVLCAWCGVWAQCGAGRAWLRSHGRAPAVPGVDGQGEPVAWE